MLDKNKDILIENVAIVQSQDSNSLLPPTVAAHDFFNFMGDINKTVQLNVSQSEAVGESPWLHIRSLFGAWIESGDEDKQLEALYQSRLIPSSMPDEDE
jgi:hypothetical protein